MYLCFVNKLYFIYFQNAHKWMIEYFNKETWRLKCMQWLILSRKIKKYRFFSAFVVSLVIDWIFLLCNIMAPNRSLILFMRIILVFKCIFIYFKFWCIFRCLSSFVFEKYWEIENNFEEHIVCWSLTFSTWVQISL